MNIKAKFYLSFTIAAALAAAVALYLAAPVEPTAEAVKAVAILGVLALVSEALALLMPNSVTGSIAFIPYLATVLVVPNWLALVGLVAVRLVTELLAKRATTACLLNVAAHALTCSCAVLVFVVTGGQSMAALTGVPLSQVTIVNGVPAVLAFAASFAINSSVVLGYIAARDRRPFAGIWRSTLLSTIGLDILASPIVFLFAWIYINWGAFAAALLWVPVLGLRQLHKNNLELEQNNSELLELMVKSMEARDPYTSGHSRRVQHFSVAIARALNLPANEIERVSRASLLHDVGKIHEKYAPILRKPGKLTPDEWQTMQEHPADGSALVSTMTRLQDIVAPIRHHHERWDGTGYPDGLAGETIPLISRIIAFADTIDAMTSERSYRRPMSEEEVRGEIVKCRGSQFDPVMADKILSASAWRLLFAPAVVEAPRDVLPLRNKAREVAGRP